MIERPWLKLTMLSDWHRLNNTGFGGSTPWGWWWWKWRLVDEAMLPLTLLWAEIEGKGFNAERREFAPNVAPVDFELPIYSNPKPGALLLDVWLRTGVRWKGRDWVASFPLAIKANDVGRPQLIFGHSISPNRVEVMPERQAQEGNAVQSLPPITPRQGALFSHLADLESADPRPVLISQVDAGLVVPGIRDVGAFSIGDVEQLVQRGYLHATRNAQGQIYEAAVTAEGLAYIDARQGASNMQSVAKEDSAEKRRTVFVVHGQNKPARDAMYSFLRGAGLAPLTWDDAVELTGQGSPYVGDVIRAGMDAARAIVVLLTGDDLASLQTHLLPSGKEPETPKPQPRPNVLFEAGMAIGINEPRTILVEIGELRGMSDVTGRHTVRMDNSPDARKRLLNRLQTAGCTVKWTGDWLTDGHFPDF